MECGSPAAAFPSPTVGKKKRGPCRLLVNPPFNTNHRVSAVFLAGCQRGDQFVIL